MSVDDRIVAMKFDNAGFEAKIGDTLKSLDKLNQSLNFSNASRGMHELSAASSRVDLSPMGAGIDGVGAKFIALTTVGVAAIATLVSKAVSAGIQIAKSLTIAPVLGGFQEYETNMNSIQTILANTSSKGTNLQTVNDALDELNTYSDQTIYNFGEMARNIGTFTAAGVDLERATQSIKGIANLAALSGSNSMQASTAMYQLSQAISAGSVKLMDWNSVTNAGIGGEVFQKALFETGKALKTIPGVPIDTTFEAWQKASGPFRTSLSETASGVDDVGSRVVKASKDANKAIASARKSAAESATRGAESIARAEESKVKAFANATKSINSAVESQKRTIESAAKNSQTALDRVTAAQERLKEAMKPEDADDMQAATDELISSQLDQKDLANAITEAEKKQKRATEDLTKAKASAAKAKTPAQTKTGGRRVADAEARLVEISEALTRARLQQNAGVRSLHDAEERLTEAKKKGTSEDERVIEANKALSDAEKDYVDTKAEGVKNAIEAAENVRDAELQAAESRKDAIKSVSEARKSAAESDISSSERVADAIENAAERVKSANEGAGGAAGKMGWLTDDVLTSTLAAFTGDLDKSKLMDMGYSDAQAEEMMRLGKIAKESATIVKTFTQLKSTVKENIESGWSSSWRNIIGDFDEAKMLYTGINNFVKKMVDSSTDARNDVLKEWKKLGGRDALIQGLKDAIGALGGVIRPIKEAFRDIFPRKTGEQLYEMTLSFSKFMREIKPSPEVINNIKRIFAGLFAVVEIGWTIMKGLFTVIGSIVRAIFPAGGALLGFSANIGDMLVKFNEMLVGGGKIKEFFAKISEWILVPSKFIQQFIDTLGKLFAKKDSSGAEEAIGRVTDRMDNLRMSWQKFTSIPPGLQKFFDNLKLGFDRALVIIKQWFSELGTKIAESMSPGDFDPALDLINVGLFASLILLFRKFIKQGLKLDFGGILEKASGVLDLFTSKMKAMQANVKADTLMKIAIAIGILTASLLVLSMINSASLTKALVAIAVGFAQLVGVMAILDKISSGPKGAATVAILTAAMIAMSTAMVILAVALKILSTIDPGDMATALAGLGVSLGILVTSMMFISTNAHGLIAASLAMIAISASLVILAGALKLFATMSWTELAKGLGAVAVGLGIIVIAMSFMPIASTIAAGLAMIPLAIGITILAGAVNIFAQMAWGDMLKGLVGMAAALVIIAVAMGLMPLTLPLTAAGMLILALAMTVMAGAVLAMGAMDLGTLAKGIGAIAAMLVILAFGMALMTGAMAGALALTVVSQALFILAIVLKKIGELGLGTIIVGLIGIAAVLLLLGVAAAVLSPLIPALYALGIALAIIGGAFALFGIGAMLVAKAFEAMAKAGKVGVTVLIDIIKMMIAALPEFVGQLAKSLYEMAGEILEIFPMLVRLIGAFLIQLLDTLIKIIPKLAEAIGVLISAIIKLIREKFPEMLIAGFDLLMTFLRGVRDNIGEVTRMGVDIMVNFATALTDNIVKIVDAGIALLLGFLKAITDRIHLVVAAGLSILVNLLAGITDNIIKVVNAVTTLISVFVSEISRNASRLVTAGAEALVRFLEGFASNTTRLITAGKDMVIKILEGVADNTIDFTTKVATLLVNFLNALAAVIRVKNPELIAAGKNVAKAIGEGFIKGLEEVPILGQVLKLGAGAIDAINKVFDNRSPSHVFEKIGINVVRGLALGLGSDIAKNSAVVQAEKIVKAFEKTLSKTPNSIVGLGDLNPVITPVLDLTRVRNSARDIDAMLAYSAISPNVSYQKARLISTTTELEASATEVSAYTGPTEVTFEQNNYSPSALSTNDIYRNTKSQIALAKEELGIS